MFFYWFGFFFCYCELIIYLKSCVVMRVSQELILKKKKRVFKIDPDDIPLWVLEDEER